MMNIFKKRMVIVSTLCAALVLVASCSKDDNPSLPGLPNGKKAKFTIKVNGATSDAYISFVIVGGDYNHTKTVWKVNGATQNNEESVSLDKDDFTGNTKTYVVESIVPLNVVTTGIQCLAFDNPYTVSYKAEIDGKVETDDQDITVEENKDYTHDFNY